MGLDFWVESGDPLEHNLNIIFKVQTHLSYFAIIIFFFEKRALGPRWAKWGSNHEIWNAFSWYLSLLLISSHILGWKTFWFQLIFLTRKSADFSLFSWLENLLISSHILGWKTFWFQLILLARKSADFSSYSWLENLLISSHVLGWKTFKYIDNIDVAMGIPTKNKIWISCLKKRHYQKENFYWSVNMKFFIAFALVFCAFSVIANPASKYSNFTNLTFKIKMYLMFHR